MIVTVDVKGLDATLAKIRGLPEKKINVAAVAALNSAAFKASQATKEEMARVFDRPTKWVAGGVRYVKARKDKLQSVVDFDKWGNKTGVTVEHVLNAQIKGGGRRHKRHEKALRLAGVLPEGMMIVPGQAADMDQYGNMKGSQIVQILSWFRAFAEQGFRANSTTESRQRRMKGTKNRAGTEYFAVSPGAKRSWQRQNGNMGSKKMQPGIYKRYFLGGGSMIKPVMIFIKAPYYRKRFDFYGVAERTAIKEFNYFFPMYLNQLLRERGL